MADSDADIVVAGAGHNSLLAACYLARAGYRCLVLDARPVPGGGAATEELLLPGFGIDTCAPATTMSASLSVMHSPFPALLQTIAFQ